MRPESVIAAAISASGSITATTSTPASAAISRAASSPAPAAELQAMINSFAPRSSRKRVLRSTHASSCSGALGSVGEVGVVAEVDEVLSGQRDQALVQHGQPADAGVEDGDRQRRVGRAARFIGPESSTV